MDRRRRRVQLFIFTILLAASVFADDLILNVNTKKPISITDEKFLSLTIDPETLLISDALSTNFEKTVNMAKGLAPAYVRLGGPSSNFDRFRSHRNSPQKEDSSRPLLSGSHWVLINQWAERTGLDVIACLAPNSDKNDDRTNSNYSEDMLDVISFSDHMAYNRHWQLGYECQSRSNTSAAHLARRVLSLRKLLDDFPRYSNSIIIGPDIIAYKMKEEQEYLQDYFDIAGRAISAVTWHPNFTSATLDEEGVSLNYDSLAIEKDNLYKAIGPLIDRKPLWIAESKPEACKDQFLGALLWTRRLGNAAKLRAEVLMRQPADLTNPTPDYWVSLLHKTLVAGAVFDAKVQGGNKSHVHFYSHCTKPSGRYERGSVTVFGVNLTPNDLVAHLRGLRVTTLHKYILLPGFDTPYRAFAKTVLMNGEPLGLINGTDVPSLKPEIVTDRREQGLSLPAGAIGFWVLPDAKLKACMETHENGGERGFLRRSLRRTINLEVAKNQENEPRERSDSSRTRRRRKKERRASNEEKHSQRMKRSNARKDLEAIKKLLKEELETREDSASNRSREISNATEGAVNGSEPSQPAASVHSVLYILKIGNPSTGKDGNLKDGKIHSDGEISKDLPGVPETRGALRSIEGNASNETEKQTSVNVKDHLRFLHDVLNSMHPDTSDSAPVSQEKLTGEQSKRSKRDLDGNEEGGLTVRKDILQKIRARGEGLRARRNERKERMHYLKKKEDARREVQPSALPSRHTESGENNFYGFFKREPIKGFPQGDVFLTTGDSSRGEDYDYVKDDDESGQHPETSHRNTAQHQDAEDGWVVDEDDYQGYAPNEFFESVRIPGQDRVKENLREGLELTEAEDHNSTAELKTNQDHSSQGKRCASEQNLKHLVGHYKEGSSQTEGLRSLKDPGESTNANVGKWQRKESRKPMTLLGSEAAKGDMEFSMEYHEIPQKNRLRRMNEDMDKILTQEMINEDDENSKDCRCRVIRSSGEPSKTCYCRVKRNTGEANIPENIDPISVVETPVETIQHSPKEEQQPKIDGTQPQFETLTAQSTESLFNSASAGVEPLNTTYEMDALNKTLEVNGGNVETAISDTEQASEILPTEVHQDEVTENILELTTCMDSIRNVRESVSEAPNPNANSDLIQTKNPISEDNKYSSTETSTERLGRQFFRDQSSKPKEETTAIDLAQDTSERPSDAGESVTSKTSRDPARGSTASEFKATESAESAGPGAATAPTVPKEELAERTRGPGADNVYDQITNGPLKREVELSTTPATGDWDASTSVQPRRASGRLGSSQRKKGRTNERTEDSGQLQEARLPEKRLQSAARRENEKRGRKIIDGPARSPSNENKNRRQQRERVEQLKRLRERLRDKRDRMVQQYPTGMSDAAEKIKEEGKKRPKRREVWERIKGGGEFRDTPDSGNMAYVLMYKPVDQASKRKQRSKDADGIEVLRGRNVRDRIANGRSPRNFADPSIMRHSDPRGFGKMIRLEDIDNEEVTARRVRYSDNIRGNGKTYYALVENLREPMILEEEKPNRKRSSQAQFKRYCDNYRYREMNEAEEDKENESDEFRLGQRVYMIDPSTYRGGEPTLQLHEDSLESERSDAGEEGPGEELSVPGSHVDDDGKDASEIFIPSGKFAKWERNEPRNNDEPLCILDIPMSSIKSRKFHDDHLLRTSIKFSSPNSEVGSLKNEEAGTGKNVDADWGEATNGKPANETRDKDNAMRADTIEKLKEVEGSPQWEVNRDGRTETHAAPAVTEQVPGRWEQGNLEDDINSKTRIAEEHTDNDTQFGEKLNGRRNKRAMEIRGRSRLFRAAPSLLRDKASRRGRNYICLKEVSGESSEEDSPDKLFQITRREDHYVAVPLESSGLVRSPQKPEPRHRLADDYEDCGDFCEDVSDDAFEDYIDLYSRDAYAGQLYGHDYFSSPEFGDEDWEHYGDDVFDDQDFYGDQYAPPHYRRGRQAGSSRKNSAASGTEKRTGRSGKSVKSKDIASRYGVVMLLPWKQQKSRHRREVTSEDQGGKSQSIPVESSEQKTLPPAIASNHIDSFEHSILGQKLSEEYPVSKIFEKDGNADSSGKDSRLPTLIEDTIPKLQDVVVDGLRKAQNLTGSVEHLIEHVNEEFEDAGATEDWENVSTTQNVFHSVISNMKKFFTFLHGFTHMING